MKRRMLGGTLVGLLGTLLSIAQTMAPFAAQTKTTPGLEGEWQGTLDTGGTKLRLVLKVTKNGEGMLTATLDTLDQNAKGIPVSSIEQSGGDVKLEVAAVGGSYAGKMSAGGIEIVGEWKQGGGSLPLVFKRNVLASLIAGPAPPTTPAAPAADYEALARTVPADLAARRFDKVFAQFDERMAKALPADKLVESWDSLRAQVGEFKSIESVKREERQGYHVVHVICVFDKLKMDMTIAFDGRQHIATLRTTAAQVDWTPPAYVKTDSFHEIEVTVGVTPWQLPGTLTLPNGPGPFPAVVLVHGSGPNDRDESVGSNKTFKDLAWGLAGQGIAVLRYDKRTKTHGREIVQLTNLTVKEETVDDARAAADLLASQPEIQAKHVFVLGHSLGGYVGPRIAVGDAKVAGLILLAGSTRPMEELVVEQVRYLAGLNGKITPQGQEAIERVEKEEAAIRNPDLKPGTTVTLLGIPVPSTYFLDLRGYHPAEMAATLHIPILVLQGDRDYQVRMADFDGWKKSLGNQPTASFKTYPALNHLFMPG
ncbi:MAG TPA: alpha/beta fold hydrolase, partial [Terriglobales bacterium]